MQLRWLILVACVAAGCRAGNTDRATMFRATPEMTGVYNTRPADWIGGVRFTISTGGSIRSAPAVYQGLLYFGSTDGIFYAVDAKTGAERWRLKTNGAIVSSPAASGGSIFFTSRDGTLYSVDARDGKPRWKHRFGADLGEQDYWDFYLSSPTLADGKLFIGSGDGHVYAFDPANGHQLWAYDAGSRIRSTVAVHAGLVVFGTNTGHVRAVKESDGTQAWSFATDGASHTFEDNDNDTTSLFGSPTIAGDTVLAGGRDGFVYSLELATGHLRWKTTHDGSSWILSSAFDGTKVYIGSGSASILQAADPATGKEAWRFATRSAIFGSPTLAGHSLLFSDFSGTLYAIDTGTGASLWQFPMGGLALSTPVVADGLVYCGSDNGVMYALAVADRPSTQAAKPRRIVYREGLKTPKAFSWFQNGTDVAILEQLKSAGYEQLDATQLEAFLRSELTARTPSVVVFADNKIPAAVASDTARMPLIRQYLDAGGKIALLGPNPLAYVQDPATGDVNTVDYKLPGRVFGVTWPERKFVNGYYASAPTQDGRAFGLRNALVGSMPIDVKQNSHVTVLATDEFGKASEWLRNYGGPPGTGLLQLAGSRQAAPDISEYRAAIEAGVTW